MAAKKSELPHSILQSSHAKKTLPLNQVESVKVSRFSFTKMNTFTHLVHRVERQTPKYIMQQSTKPQLPHRDFNRQMGGKTKKNREHVTRGNLEINTRIKELTLKKKDKELNSIDWNLENRMIILSAP